MKMRSTGAGKKYRVVDRTPELEDAEIERSLRLVRYAAPQGRHEVAGRGVETVRFILPDAQVKCQTDRKPEEGHEHRHDRRPRYGPRRRPKDHDAGSFAEFRADHRFSVIRARSPAREGTRPAAASPTTEVGKRSCFLAPAQWELRVADALAASAKSMQDNVLTVVGEGRARRKSSNSPDRVGQQTQGFVRKNIESLRPDPAWWFCCSR